MIKNSIVVGLLLLIPTFALAEAGHGHGHGHHGEEHEDEGEKGQHGGKLFHEGDFEVEVTIFEEGIEPQFRIYSYYDEKKLDPKDVELSVELSRFGRGREIVNFTPLGDYLVSNTTVQEPHSFDAKIEATYQDKTYSWEFASHEGRTELSKEAFRLAKVKIAKVSGQSISNSVRVYGKLLANENKVAHMTPRFPGVVTDIRKSLGDSVEKGEVLATIESNQSLQSYNLKSQVAGVIIKRHASLGEFVSDTRELFIVADLSEVWADFQVYRDDFEPISVGQQIKVELGDGSQTAATISYVSPVVDEATQSKLVRTVLANPSGNLRPGLFVSGVLLSSETDVAMAVTRGAIQSFRDWKVVYITDGHVFQAMPVELGRKDADYVEVLSGLEIGDRYVSDNSFIIKADIEKAGASHDH